MLAADDEAPTIQRLHGEFIPQHGLAENGLHHEIHLRPAQDRTSKAQDRPGHPVRADDTHARHPSGKTASRWSDLVEVIGNRAVANRCGAYGTEQRRLQARVASRTGAAGSQGWGATNQDHAYVEDELPPVQRCNRGQHSTA
jgi:hypothetical protein